MDFAHLHVHSVGSILDGYCKLDKLREKAESLNHPAIAITDHGNIFMAYKFWKEFKNSKVKPILGQEFYIVKGSRKEKESREMYHLVLLAKNAEGWKNLCRLSSIAFTEGFYYKPRIDHEVLVRYNKGLICMSACLAGEVAQDILAGKNEDAEQDIAFLQELFQDDFYIEVMPHDSDDQRKVNTYLARYVEWGNLVATNDAHYIEAEDEPYHSFLLKIQTASSGKQGLQFSIKDLFVKTRAQMKESFLRYHPSMGEASIEQALDNTLKIVEKIEPMKFDASHKVPVYGG